MAGGPSLPSGSPGRDGIQQAIALKARRGKLRRRLANVLCCTLVFILAVAALLMLATLASEGVNHEPVEAPKGANAANGARRVGTRVREELVSTLNIFRLALECTTCELGLWRCIRASSGPRVTRNAHE